MNFITHSSIDYPHELIQLVCDSERKSGIANISCMIVYLIALYEVLPSLWIIFWVIAQFTYFIARSYTFSKLKYLLSIKTVVSQKQKINDYLTIIIFLFAEKSFLNDVSTRIILGIFILHNTITRATRGIRLKI